MYQSEFFGRHFWVDDDLELKSAPSYIDGTADFELEDYVSNWEDWEGVNVSLLLDIYKCEILNKKDYAGSLSHKGA